MSPMTILVLNCGSSSVRFQLVATDVDLIEQDADRYLARGHLERFGPEALISFHAEGQPPIERTASVADHRAAIEIILRWIKSLGEIHAVGHRVVHGGERFQQSVRIDEDVLVGIEACAELAPLHNPVNLRGIRAAAELLGADVPQVAVFDTAFHATMPDTSYLYALPMELYQKHHIRRYGFHGTSHRYVAGRYQKQKGLSPDAVNIITVHLGNGCSACAIKNGKSFDTSMGFTPLEGLVMGTRSGDIDPSIIGHLVAHAGMRPAEIDTMLNFDSGLLGLSGLSSDMRTLLEADIEKKNIRARLAIDIFCQRVKKYIGGYIAEMGGADAVIFTGGIGENSPVIRARICKGLECLGLTLDSVRNFELPPSGGEISTPGSALKCLVIPTNEELMIARDTVRVVERSRARI
ncbi:MAG: acetate kinase [candidate division Zixibacteria bacterium]|nr:acetate kinase [candidate division Zixibacteria bacterium]